jgi:hypothetical protein
MSHDLLVLLSPCEEMKRPHAKVETIQDGISGDQDTDQEKPGGVEIHFS